MEGVGGQAPDEKRTLLVAGSMAGYFVSLTKPGQPKPYRAGMKRGGKEVQLGYFATAEEAALFVARSQEARAVRAAAQPVPASKGAELQEEEEDLLHRSLRGHKILFRRIPLSRQRVIAPRK